MRLDETNEQKIGKRPIRLIEVVLIYDHHIYITCPFRSNPISGKHSKNQFKQNTLLKFLVLVTLHCKNRGKYVCIMRSLRAFVSIFALLHVSTTVYAFCCLFSVAFGILFFTTIWIDLVHIQTIFNKLTQSMQHNVCVRWQLYTNKNLNAIVQIDQIRKAEVFFFFKKMRLFF